MGTSFPTVISFATPAYKEHMARLRQSLEKFGLPHHLMEVEDAGGWVKNCGRKAQFVFECLYDKGSSVLWLDADAEVMQYPADFRDRNFSFAICDRGKPLGFGSGTVYFAPASLPLVGIWRSLVDKYPEEIDQVLLQRAWWWMKERQCAPYTYWLPPSYLQKIDNPEGAVILHHQASRQLRKK